MTDTQQGDLYSFATIEALKTDTNQTIRCQVRADFLEEMREWVSNYDEYGAAPDDIITVMLNIAAQMTAEYYGQAGLEEPAKRIGSEFTDVVLKCRSGPRG
jgi:hypothetical protein